MKHVLKVLQNTRTIHAEERLKMLRHSKVNTHLLDTHSVCTYFSARFIKVVH